MNKTWMFTVSLASLVATGGIAGAQGMNEPRDKPVVAAPAQNDKSDRLKRTPNQTEIVKTGPNTRLPAKATGDESETAAQESNMPPVQHAAMPDGRIDPRQPTEVDVKHGAPATLSAEQHAKFRDTIRGEKVAPFTGAKFAMTVGGEVPQAVHLNPLPAQIMEYAPQYRGYEYLQVGDEILIVDPQTHKIVAVIVA